MKPQRWLLALGIAATSALALVSATSPAQAGRTPLADRFAVPHLDTLGGQTLTSPTGPRLITIPLTSDGQAMAVLTGGVTDQRGAAMPGVRFQLTGSTCVLFRDGHAGQVKDFAGTTDAAGRITTPNSFRPEVVVLFICPGPARLRLAIPGGLVPASVVYDSINVTPRPVQDAGASLDAPPVQAGQGCVTLAGGAAPGATVHLLGEYLNHGDAPLALGAAVTDYRGRWQLNVQLSSSMLVWAAAGGKESVRSVAWILTDGDSQAWAAEGNFRCIR